jgi:hypothetical protein
MSEDIFSVKVNPYGTIYVPKSLGLVTPSVKLRRNVITVRLYLSETKGSLVRVYLFSQRLMKIIKFKREGDIGMVFQRRGSYYLGKIKLVVGWRKEFNEERYKFLRKISGGFKSKS